MTQQPQQQTINVFRFDDIKALIGQVCRTQAECGKVINDIRTMHKVCFKTEFNPLEKIGGQPTGGVIAYLLPSLEVLGFLNYVNNKKDQKKLEIYNVCVNPNYQKRGIAGLLLNALQKDIEYYLQVEFGNKAAYSTYSKYFFCDFLVIGKLSHSVKVGFIMGGKVNNPCSEQKKNDIRGRMDKISTLIEIIQKITKIPFDVYFEHYFRNKETYDFINKNRDLIVEVYRLKDPKIQLSRDVEEILKFGNPTSNPMWINLMFIDSDIIMLMNV
jgi:ribosomal protein S18 acetylase RimI-like enzyme